MCWTIIRFPLCPYPHCSVCWEAVLMGWITRSPCPDFWLGLAIGRRWQEGRGRERNSVRIFIPWLPPYWSPWFIEPTSLHGAHSGHLFQVPVLPHSLLLALLISPNSVHSFVESSFNTLPPNYLVSESRLFPAQIQTEALVLGGRCWNY